MAESTGKDTPATDPKAAAKAGPVRPPVLEGKARPAAGEKAADSTPAGRAVPPPGDEARPGTGASGEAEGKGGNAWLAGIVGGAVGLGAAYGLAWLGLWPAPPQAPIPADPRLAQFATTIPELETVTGTVQDELSTLTARVGSLESAQAAPVAASVGTDPAVTEQLASLTARVQELADESGSSETTQSLAALEAELASLRDDNAAAQAQLAETRQQLEALTRSTSETAGADAATLRLPLIFSGLESAFDSGRSFAPEMAALRQALPDATVPEAIAVHAANGLPRPDLVSGQLASVLPDMLAGRPLEADAGWQDATADWFRGLIAMRPAGAVEGGSPDAVIARLEAAVERRDFVAAQAEFETLPEPMRRAAGTVAADIETLATAQAFLAQLRSAALDAEAGV